jgi:hypothetical protein
MKVQSKIKNNNRKWELSIPAPLMKGMNWKDDIVNIEALPEENSLKITNQMTRPLTNFEFISNFKNYEFGKNPKKYQKELNETLSPDGREVLHSTAWEEVDDGGYFNIKFTWDAIQNIKQNIKNANSEKLKDAQRPLIGAYKYYIKNLLEFLKEKGGKEPSWFSPWFNSIKKDYESLNQK